MSVRCQLGRGGGGVDVLKIFAKPGKGGTESGIVTKYYISNYRIALNLYSICNMS